MRTLKNFWAKTLSVATDPGAIVPTSANPAVQTEPGPTPAVPSPAVRAPVVPPTSSTSLTNRLHDDPELHRSLMIEEYKAMRAKSSEARDNQQSILQWSLAASGVVAAGAITGFARDEPTREFELAVSVALTIVVPLILVAAFAFWLSEVARMLRAARYLREREDSLVRAHRTANSSGSSNTAEVLQMFDNYPLVWENLLLVRGWKGQADLGPFAVTAIYVSLTSLSALSGCYVANGIERLSWTVERGIDALGATFVLTAVCLAFWGFFTSRRERSQPSAGAAGGGATQTATTSSTSTTGSP